MNRGNTRAFPIPANLPMQQAVPMIQQVHYQETPALRHHGMLPNNGLPKAEHPVRFSQDRRSLTAATVDDPNDFGGAGSLAYRSARLQQEQKLRTIANGGCVTDSCMKSVIVDFDSNQSNAVAKRNSNFGNARVGETTLRLPNTIVSLRAHRLLYAQISAYELVNNFFIRAFANVENTSVNAASYKCNEDQFSLGISEIFVIDCRNQIVNVLPDASVALPRTLTEIDYILQLKPKKKPEKGKKHCPLYVFKTIEEHDYVSGLLFYCLWGSDQVVEHLQSPDCVSLGEMDAKNNPFAPDCSTPCFEIVQILDACRFVARFVLFTEEVPTFKPFNKKRCAVRNAAASLVFTNPNTNLTSLALEPDSYLWCDPFVEKEICQEHYCAFYTCNATASCLKKCGSITAYIPPPTSPYELAEFTFEIVQSMQEYIVNQHLIEHPLLDVDTVVYDGLTDTYVAKQYSSGITFRYRTLLNTSKGSSSVLNYPFRRKAMFASELGGAFEKQIYIQNVLDGNHHFVLKSKTCENCFCVLTEDGQTQKICIPNGCYRGNELAHVIQCNLNEAFELLNKRFEVCYALLSVDALQQYAEENSTVKTENGLPPCYNEVYQVQAFGFIIRLVWTEESLKCSQNKNNNNNGLRFKANFAIDPQFANVLDIEPRCFDFGCSVASRSFPSNICPQKCMQKCSIDCNDSCGPCIRRQYTAYVDSVCNLVTLSQNIIVDIEGTISDPTDEEIEQDHPENGATACQWIEMKLSTMCDSCSIPPNECGNCFDGICNPFCVGDVVWILLKNCEDGKGYVGAIVTSVHLTPKNPCIVRIGISKKISPITGVSVHVKPSPVGFNLHLHPVEPPKQYNEMVAQKSPLARWLGFTIPFTRTGNSVYTSDHIPETVLDERIVLVLPELVTLGLSEQRENHYQSFSPFDLTLNETYNVLSLDRVRGVYRFDAGSGGPTLEYGLGIAPPTNVLASPGSSQQPCPTKLSFLLYRTDGRPYLTGGFALAASLEMIFC